MVTDQLQVERGTGKGRWPKTDVLPLCHTTSSRGDALTWYTIKKLLTEIFDMLEYSLCHYCICKLPVFRLWRLHAVHRCILLLQMLHVAWSVCLCVGHTGELCRILVSSVRETKTVVARTTSLLIYWSIDWLGVEGKVWYRGWEVPGCFFCVSPIRSIPKPDQHRRDIIQQESLGTDEQQLHKISHWTEK